MMKAVTSQPPDPAVVTRAIVANRRAAQLLRLLDEGDSSGVDDLLAHAETVADLVFIEANLVSIRRTSKTGDDDPDVAARLESMSKEPRTRDDLLAWVLASADYTLERLTEKWPNATDRAAYYKLAGRRAYQGEEPGSFLRRSVFGEGQSG